MPPQPPPGIEPRVRHRLWSVDEIAAFGEWFAPRRLADLLPPLLRGDLPTEPIEIGG